MGRTLPEPPGRGRERPRVHRLSAASGGCGGRTPGTSVRASAGVSPSTHRWVTGSSGSGSTRTQPRSWFTFTPSIRSTSRPWVCSTRVRMTMPFCSHGVTTSSWSRWRVRARGPHLGQLHAPGGEQVEHLEQAAGGVERGQEPRQDDAALPVGGEADARARRPPPSGRRRRSWSSAPGSPGTRTISAAARGAVTGRATASPSRRSHTRSRKQNSSSSSVSTAPLVVDQGQLLARGVDHGAQVGARGPHQVGHPGGVGLPVELHEPGGGGERVDRQHLGAQLGQHVGHGEAGRAVGVVDHHLEAALGDRLHVDGLLERHRVLLERPGHQVDVADVGGADPTEVLTGEQPLDLALAGPRGCRRRRRRRTG